MGSLIDKYDKNKIITESTIIEKWESCKLLKKHLPDEQCVYAVSMYKTIIYIGSTISLKNRLWEFINDSPLNSILIYSNFFTTPKNAGIRTCLSLGLYDEYDLAVHYKIWDGYSKDRFKLEYQLIKSIRPVLNVAGAYREPDYNPVQEFFKNLKSFKNG